MLLIQSIFPLPPFCLAHSLSSQWLGPQRLGGPGRGGSYLGCSGKRPSERCLHRHRCGSAWGVRSRAGGDTSLCGCVAWGGHQHSSSVRGIQEWPFKGRDRKGHKLAPGTGMLGPLMLWRNRPQHSKEGISMKGWQGKSETAHRLWSAQLTEHDKYHGCHDPQHGERN